MKGLNILVSEIKNVIKDKTKINTIFNEMRIRIDPRPLTGAERQRLYKLKKLENKPKKVKK